MSTILDIHDVDNIDDSDQLESNLDSDNHSISLTDTQNEDDAISTVSTKCNSIVSATTVSRSHTLKYCPHYLAPEQIDGACKDSKKAEIWAVGVILYAMTAGFFPFGGEIEMRRSNTTTTDPFYPFPTQFSPSNHDDISIESRRITENINTNNMEPYPDRLSDGLKTLLNGIFVLDPEERFTLQDIRNCNWMDLGPEISELSEKSYEKMKMKINLKDINGMKNMKEDSSARTAKKTFTTVKKA